MDLAKDLVALSDKLEKLVANKYKRARLLKELQDLMLSWESSLRRNCLAKPPYDFYEITAEDYYKARIIIQEIVGLEGTHGP